MDVIYEIEDLDHRVQQWAQEHHAAQTMAALPYASAHHAGQYRKGSAHIPYIYHPLMMACHAIEIGAADDDLVAALLVHDVCEDCRNEEGGPILPGDLPVGEAAREAVRLVTKEDPLGPGWEARYYGGIASNQLAMLVKLYDRCNNVSGMASGFTRERMAAYIDETERYILPFLDALEASADAGARRTAFLLRYQLVSDIENCKHLLRKDHL